MTDPEADFDGLMEHTMSRRMAAPMSDPSIEEAVRVLSGHMTQLASIDDALLLEFERKRMRAISTVLSTYKSYEAESVEAQRLATTLASVEVAHDNLNAAYKSNLDLLREAAGVLDELMDLFQATLAGDYKPDSFTLQPAEIFLARIRTAIGSKDDG